MGSAVTAQALKRAAGRVLTSVDLLAGDRTAEPLRQGKFEAPKHAWALSNLVIRHTESTAYLARSDVRLLPAGWVTSRSAMESMLTIAWLLAPDDPWEREARWVLLAEEGVRHYEYLGDSASGLAADNARIAGKIGGFVEAVRAKLTDQVTFPPGMPNVRDRAEGQGPLVYDLYKIASQYTHGTDAALTLYRRNLGTEAEFGEFIAPYQWVPPLRLAWESAVASISLVAASVGVVIDRDVNVLHSKVLEGLSALSESRSTP